VNATNSFNTIENQYNIETQNNININVSPELLETFVMHIKELKNKKLSDCFQKVLLEQMMSENSDIMDYLEEFDKRILEESERIFQEHKIFCRAYKSEKYANDEGLECFRTKRIAFEDLPEDYKFDCEHENTRFKVSEKSVCQILSDILMSNAIKLVITHDNQDLEGTFRILFKHVNSLHDDNILLQFINKSSNLDKLNISENFKPIEILKKRYPDFYKTLEDKVRRILNKYNNITKS
jgi:hypothetical protein